MQIKFLFEMDDWMAFQRYYLKHSKVLNITQWIAYGLIVVTVGSSFVRTVLEGEHHVLPLVLTGLIMLGILIGVFFLFRWLFSKMALLLTRLILKDGDNQGLLGEHILTFDEEGIHSKMPESETKITWKGYKKLGVTPDHYFIYNTSNSATVIPRNKVAEHRTELDAILEEKMGHLKAK